MTLDSLQVTILCCHLCIGPTYWTRVRGPCQLIPMTVAAVLGSPQKSARCERRTRNKQGQSKKKIRIHSCCDFDKKGDALEIIRTSIIVQFNLDRSDEQNNREMNINRGPTCSPSSSFPSTRVHDAIQPSPAFHKFGSSHRGS